MPGDYDLQQKDLVPHIAAVAKQQTQIAKESNKEMWDRIDREEKQKEKSFWSRMIGSPKETHLHATIPIQIGGKTVETHFVNKAVEAVEKRGAKQNRKNKNATVTAGGSSSTGVHSQGVHQ